MPNQDGVVATVAQHSICGNASHDDRDKSLGSLNTAARHA